eukprot:COSAG02_NODE_48949_length_330_cov_0.874459_1_plen_64_part_10
MYMENVRPLDLSGLVKTKQAKIRRHWPDWSKAKTTKVDQAADAPCARFHIPGVGVTQSDKQRNS